VTIKIEALVRRARRPGLRVWIRGASSAGGGGPARFRRRSWPEIRARPGDRSTAAGGMAAQGASARAASGVLVRL